MQNNYCIATATSDNFCPGTEVLLSSFLKHNPWFQGDIIIFIDTFLEENKIKLEQIYPVVFRKRSEIIEEKITILHKKVPELRRDLASRLLSLEIFLLHGYQKVVFLDSDAFCIGDLSALFTETRPLAAVGDGFHYEDLADSLLQQCHYAPISTKERYSQGITKSFNTGVLSVDQSLLNESTYLGITALLEDISIWENFGLKGFTDQMLMNIYFNQQIHYLSARYNFMPFMEAYLQELEQISLPEVCMIHFAGTLKPWHQFDWSEVLTFAPHYIKYLQLWQEAYWQRCHGHDQNMVAKRIMQQFHWMEENQLQKINSY